MELLGRVAVVTGGAGGLGRAFARALARQGVDIVIADVDLQRMERVLADLQRLHSGIRLLSLVTDVCSDSQVRSLARDAVRAMGRVDLLVNAHAVLLQGRLDRITADDWHWMLDTNLLGTVRTTHALLPHLLASPAGLIVNTVPVGALLPGDSRSIPYETGFAGVAAFTQGLRAEFSSLPMAVSLFAASASGPRLGVNARRRGLRSWFHTQARPLQQRVSPAAAGRAAGRLVEGIHAGDFLIIGDEADRDLISRLRPDLFEVETAVQEALASGS